MQVWTPQYRYSFLVLRLSRQKVSEVCFFATDPYEDQFLKREQEKKERVSKNEFQRLRNVGRSQKMTSMKSWIMDSIFPSPQAFINRDTLYFTEGNELAPSQKVTRNQVSFSHKTKQQIDNFETNLFLFFSQVKATINAARVSTASMGKFTPKLVRFDRCVYYEIQWRSSWNFFFLAKWNSFKKVWYKTKGTLYNIFLSIEH